MKKIGIGYENYKRILDDKCYYVDKTLLIKELIDRGGMVTLFTRPRRFGKTLALSMLRTFFELEYDREGNPIDKRRYFEGLRIMEAGEEILQMMGQYPVINLSLKSAKQDDFYNAFTMLRKEIISEYERHDYLLHSDKISEMNKQVFHDIVWGELEWEKKRQTLSPEQEGEEFKKEVGRYAVALKTLSALLEDYHGKKVIILIDEYDVPLENAWFRGFYEEMVTFIRSLFESALKTNDALERAVVTGCLRISKESIFTGLNNLEVNSIRSRNFGEYFGFTQEETEEMLRAYDLECTVPEVKRWYDGYLFGEAEVYNPWSVTKFVKEHEGAPERFAEAYWANTSSNSIIRELVEDADEEVRQELDELIGGGTIEKRVHEDITYGDIHENEDNLWNFLFFTGYMRKVSERKENDDIYLTMRIPNAEVKSIYRNQIRTWFDKVVKASDRKELYQAVLKKDADVLSRMLTGMLKRSISTFDSSESFYHGYLLSMLVGTPDYTTRSNREAGDGRPDIILYPLNPRDPAYLFELKVRKKFNEMDDGIQEAFAQIRDKQYEEGILEDGYAGVISYGVCFCKKSCIVELYGRNSD